MEMVGRLNLKEMQPAEATEIIAKPIHITQSGSKILKILFFGHLVSFSLPSPHPH